MKAKLPSNEIARLEALQSYHILDTLPEDCYDDITLLASENCGTPIAAVSLIDKTRQWFKSKVGMTIPETARDEAFCAHAILQPDITVISDVHADKRFADNPFVIGEPWIRFYAGAPLITAKGEALGTLCVIDQVQRKLSKAQINTLRVLSRQVMAQLELRRHIELQKQTNAQLQKLSITDDVTGFNNTRFLHHYLDQHLNAATADQKKLSLVFFDMDNFKLVVDKHGHMLGAKVLKEVAEVVHAHLGSEDHIVRYGGDEFIVILPGQGGEEVLAKVEAIRKGVDSTSYLQQENIHLKVTASFGLATYPDDAEDKRQLLTAADQCLFQSKKEGKDRICSWGTNRP